MRAGGGFAMYAGALQLRAQLGFLLTIFFVVSCAVQALSGFWVDRYGPRPILFAGLSLLGVAALGRLIAYV